MPIELEARQAPDVRTRRAEPTTAAGVGRLLASPSGRAVALAAVGAVLVGASVAVHTPVLLLLGLVASVASLLVPRLALDLAVIAAAFLLVLVVAVAGIAAHLLGVSLLGAPAVLTVGVLAGAGAALVRAVRRPPGADRPQHLGRASWVAFLPAAGALGIAAVQASSLRATVRWALDSTDLAHHVAGLESLRGVGALDYAADAYPRALHLLLAVVDAATGAAPDAGLPLLEHDLQLVATATWLAVALLVATAAATTLRLAAVVRVSAPVAVLAATLAGVVVLGTNRFISAFVTMGAAPSLVACSVLWALPLAATVPGLATRARSRLLVVVAALEVALLANLWQALVVVPVVALAVAAPWPAWRHVGPLVRPVRGWLPVLPVLGLAAVVALAPLLGVLRPEAGAASGVGGGIGLAAIGGLLDAPPTALLLPLPFAVAWFTVRAWRSTYVRLLVGSALGALGVCGALLLGSGRIDLSQYYVVKAGWFLVILLLPLGAVLVTELAARALRLVGRATAPLGRGARLARTLLAVVVVAAGVAYVLPQAWVVGFQTVSIVSDLDGPTHSSRSFDLGVRYARAFSPAATLPVDLGTGALPDPLATRMTSEVMHLLTGQPVTYGNAEDLCADAERLDTGHGVVVLTTLDPALLRPIIEHDGCADVRVERVPGPERLVLVKPHPR